MKRKTTSAPAARGLPSTIVAGRMAGCLAGGLFAWVCLAATTLASAQDHTFVTLAGPPEADPGGTDGPGTVARFNLPIGVAADRAGNLYVADTGNHAIRKIRPGGEVTSLAGLAGLAGANDGFGSAARFRSPSGVTVDNAGNVYVADSGNHAIRKITPSGVVTTLAGLAGQPGAIDEVAGAARFNWPRAVAVDAASNLWVADSDNFTIRKIAPDGTVTTAAGAAGEPGSDDGAGSAARFAWPCGVAADHAGNLYVADSDNSTIRKITPEGEVTTWAGWAGQTGTNDGPARVARFNSPEGVAVDSAGNVHVADTFNHTLRKITPAGDVTTLAGSATQPGVEDGTGSAARFNYPSGVVLDGEGQAYVADWSNHTIRKVAPGGVVTTLAGLAESRGSRDGHGTAARFYNPASVAVDREGFLYVADSWNHLIRKIAPDGLVTTLAGLAEQPGSSDGSGTAARFRYPSGVAVDRAGLVYVADSGNHTIRKITPDGLVTTLAGLAGSFGTNDGAGGAAEFFNPSGAAVDSAGNVYVADTSNHTIRKVTPAGWVTTLAGTPAVSGTNDSADGPTGFSHPKGVAVHSSGHVYVADQGNQTIRKITPQGTVTTLAGAARQCGSTDGPAPAARFNYPMGLTVDAAANVYVADWGNHTLRRISPSGEVTTLAGQVGRRGSADGTGAAAAFDLPSGVAVDGAGDVYVADLGNNTLRQGIPAAPDRPVIDRRTVPVGTQCQLDVTNLSTTSWGWTFTRRPAASFADLSSSTARNPALVLDVPDLFGVRLYATNAAGRVGAIGPIELQAFLALQIRHVTASRETTLTLHSAAGQPCELLVSTNLTQWVSLTNLINVTGCDALAASVWDGPCCFCRLRQK